MKRIIEHRSEVFNEIRQSVSRTLVAAESRCYEQRQPYNGNNTAGIQDKVILIRQGMDAPDIFRALSQELAHAHMDRGEYNRADCAFTAYCVSYMLCKRNSIAVDTFRFDRLPEAFKEMDAQGIRAELGKIRDVANEISRDMAPVLEQRKAPSRDDGAR